MKEERQPLYEGLRRELQVSRAANKRHLTLLKQLVRQYSTPGWQGEEHLSSWREDYQPDNHPFKFVSFVEPQLTGGLPRVSWRSLEADPRAKVHSEARGAEHAHNRWIVDSNYGTVRQQKVRDPLFAWGAVLVRPSRSQLTYSASSVQEAWPEVERVSPTNFLRDPFALDYERCRWLGHEWAQEWDELVELAEANPEAGWNVDEVKRLAHRALQNDYRKLGHESGDAAGRREVLLVEMWWPHGAPGDDEGNESYETPENGFHGRVYTMVASEGVYGPSEGPTVLRKPFAWYGDRSGPYAHCGVHRVIDSPYPLSPLVATFGQASEVNNVLKALGRSLRNYNRGTAVDGDIPELAERLKSGQFDSVFTVRGAAGRNLKELVASIEAGGLPPDGLKWAEISRALLMQVSGMGEAQSGSAPDEATATAVAVASRDSDVRIQRIREADAEWEAAIQRKVGFYIATSEDIEIALDSEAARALGRAGQRNLRYQGGLMTPEQFEHAIIQVDPTSLERPTTERRQAAALQSHQLLLEALPMMVQLPVVEFWRAHFQRLGEAFGETGLEEEVDRFFAELPGALAASHAMGTMPRAGGEPAGPQGPRYPSVTVKSSRPMNSRNGTPGLSGVEQPVRLLGAQQGGRKSA